MKKMLCPNWADYFVDRQKASAPLQNIKKLQARIDTYDYIYVDVAEIHHRLSMEGKVGECLSLSDGLEIITKWSPENFRQVFGGDNVYLFASVAHVRHAISDGDVRIPFLFLREERILIKWASADRCVTKGYSVYMKG